ncbi:MAG: hypothetical protein GC161_15870 [Planctomycetaceae bacterium]|nr:hypothetical protein [Planctomycetaceae bacterium]
MPGAAAAELRPPRIQRKPYTGRMSPTGSSPRRWHRILVRCALATVSAGLAVALVWSIRPPPPSAEIRFAERTDTQMDTVERRSRELAPAPTALRRKLPRAALPLDVATILLPIGENNPRGNVYDPVCYYRYQPHLDKYVGLRWHPDGGWALRTNARGLKGAREVFETRPDLRILVVGDSHVDGYCADEETFARRLEGLLAEHAGGTVECLNAGHGGYAFYQYVGALELHAELEPHVFVLAVYTGNDFVESLVLRRYYAGILERGILGENTKYRAEYPWLTGGFLGQYLRQVLHFRANPQNEAIAVETVVVACLEMADRCRERGILFLPMILPSAPEVQPDRIDVDFAAVVERVGLTPRDIFSAARLTQEWTAALATHGIEVLDPRPHLKAAREPLFWPEDYHLSVAGNAAIATWLAAEIEQRWQPDAPKR